MDIGLSVILVLGEATSDRTLIYAALVSGATTLVVALIGAFVSLHNSRKLNRVAPAIHELRIEFDGRMKELIEAKESIARAAGAVQERDEVRKRMGEEAIALQAAAPAEVIQVNSPDKPAIVKLTK